MAFLRTAIILFNQNSSQDIFLFTFLLLWLTVHWFCLFLQQSAIKVKCRPISEYGQQHVFSIRWQQCRFAPDQSRMYQSLLQFINILTLHCCTTVKNCIWPTAGAQRSRDIKFIDFLGLFWCIFCPFCFSQVVQKHTLGEAETSVSYTHLTLPTILRV